MTPSGSTQQGHLKHKLALRVTLGSMVFALVAGGAMFTVEFQRQHTEATKLQDQLAATVESSAAVAAYVKNVEIAQDVIRGLMSNPLLAAAHIETDNGTLIFQSRRSNDDDVLVKATTQYPLSSPVNADEIIGRLVITRDMAYINARARNAAGWQAVVLVLQIGVSALLLIVLFDYVVARPLNAVARMVEAAIPGSGSRLQVPNGHLDDEIGSLVRSSNNLLATTEQTLDDERALRAKVEEMEEHYRRIFETTNVGIMVLNPSGNLINSNPALLSRIVGIRFDGLKESESFQFIETIFAEPSVVWGLITEASISQRSASDDCRLRTLDDSQRWVHCIISVVMGQKNQVELIEGVLYDVTDRKAEEELQRRHADHDSLTGLRNRRGMEFFLDRSLRQAAENAFVVGVLMIDLDGFKAVNDTYGHDAGDAVLREVAGRMSSRIRRTSDLVARQGGDEFMAIVTNCGTDPRTLEELAADLVLLLDAPFALGGGRTAQIGASIGIARFPYNGRTREAVIAAADAAMYCAKQAGKNRFAMAAPSHTPPDLDAET